MTINLVDVMMTSAKVERADPEKERERTHKTFTETSRVKNLIFTILNLLLLTLLPIIQLFA